MFCPKCGNKVADGSDVCFICGLDLKKLEQEKTNDVVEKAVVSEMKEDTQFSKKSIVKYVYFGLAGIVLFMFFIAASSISEGGNQIMQIQSVGGKTLEEAYYAELGLVYAGYAMISRALGIFLAAILVRFGLKEQ